MRTKTTAAIVTIALLGVVAFSVIGQEEPLPVVIPTAHPALPTIPLAGPTVVLAAEPIREYRPPTLGDAARHNDYITFDALYAAAKRRGEDVSRFDALHELWTYSMTDPIGAFYGPELYERLSRAHRGYAAFIDELRVVDSRGNVFYPTSETRAFLLNQAIEGRPAPRVLVAEAPKPEPTPVVERRPLTAAVPVVVAQKQFVAKPASARAPIVVAGPAAEAAAAPQAATAQQAAGAPQAIADAPAIVAPAVAEPVVIAAKESAPPPVPVAAPSPAPTNPNPASRGILLMIIGLIGVGLLALVLRTPREEALPIHPLTGGVDNVEPLRKAQATAPDEPRATGSAAG